MNELPNFPHISQRDGDINSVDDCVAACVAMGLEYLTGNKYTAGQVKDAVYGPSYTGGTAAINYEQYCSDQGVSLAPIDGNGGQLVTALKSEISAGHPCIITEPDPYEAGWSHCCAAFAFNNDAASITVVDPWIDQDVTKSDATWAAQLLFSQIWTMKKKDATIERTTWMSASQAQQADDYWGSTTAHAASGNRGTGGIFPEGQTPNASTGIAKAWQEEYMSGRNWGPPISYEFDSVDWDGNAIVAQMFAGGRCEWRNGNGKWYAWQ